MKLNKITEAVMWLPGFAPDEDPLEVLGCVSAKIIPFPVQKTKKAISPAAVWPRLDASVLADLSGDVTKFEANITAIETLQKLKQEDRVPTDEERIQLNRYTGWGGLPQAFNLEQKDEAWVSRAAHLKALLDEDEWKAAHASTPNSHYTSPEIIEAMWRAVQRLGFTGGRIIEPSAGVGYFIGAMPEDLARNSTVTTVELDKVTANITSKLYQQYGVRTLNEGFEKLALPEGHFDLAISNVPFGNYQVPELRNVPYQNFLIHDYFFAKALEIVRPGGLVVFITSSGTMDKHDDKVRQYLGSKANLVGAIRLPNTAFKKLANTEVTTDIVILQKPLNGRTNKAGWMETTDLPKSSPIFGDPTWRSAYMGVNQYFAANPQWVIGKLKTCSNGYHQNAIGCVFDGDLEKGLSDRIANLPEGIYSAIKAVRLPRKEETITFEETHRAGFMMIDGKVFEVSGAEAQLYRAPAKTLERIVALCPVRDAARRLIKVQAESNDDVMLTSYRFALNVAYDNFQSKHGFIHAKANKSAFRSDPDLPLLMSLELWDGETQTAEKTDIFYRRTVGVFKRLERCETAQEALTASIVELGHVSEERIGELLGQPGNVAMKELEELGAVFHDPETALWETADAYLSGDVRKKRNAAQHSGARYNRNAEALEAVIPADLAPHEIGARIGSTWIPTSDYEAFLNEILECNSNEVRFNSGAGAWHVDPTDQARYSIAATQTYGTNRANAISLFEQALNQVAPSIYDEYEGKRVVNQVKTIAAREKQQALKDKFGEWLWADDARAVRICRLYNDQFNSVVQRRFNGEHLVLPGFSQVYRLHEHQRDAIWRIVSSGYNTLLAHCVGAGKTLEMICAGMELRRLGKASKPMYVVPNHMLDQFATEFMRAYPGANILMASKDDLQGDKRRQLLSRIATGDWDGVLITHASFERIKMSEGFMKEYIQEEIDQIEDAILAEKQERGNKIVKELAKAKKSWEAKLAKLTGDGKKDDLLTFEQLGVDYILVDESHLFKNLWRFTKMTRVAGLPNSSSERAFDMFVKTRYVMGKHQGRSGVVFATGTPVSNSMAEMWVMQRYLQPKTLDQFQVGMFDSWAGNFGESVTALELSPDGSGYRMQTRFARFVNLPELMNMFGQVADIRTAEMLKLPVPKAHKETITIKASPELKAFVETLVERAERIKNGEVKPSQDNMLSVTNDGRKAALDMRLVHGNSSHLDTEGSKVFQCAHKVHHIWAKSTGTRGAQLVFCDMSTPQADGRFNVYHDLRSKLVEMGVPGVEIAFIHDYDSDAAKGELFKAVRDGRIRILLGSTGKMGVGTNVQTRLVALHHLDAPWRPSDVEQREGRIIRQGNLNEEVQIFRYVTEGSFDAYIWQTLENKSRFIAQVMRGETGLRSAEDVELAALSYAEVKALASGNPLVLEKAGIDSELAKLSVVKSQWAQQQWRNKHEVSTLPGTIEHIKDRIAAMESDLIVRNKVSGQRFSIEVDGKQFTDRSEAGEAILLAMRGIRGGDERVIGNLAGFPVLGKSHRHVDMGKTMAIIGGIDYVAGQAATPSGYVRVLEHALQTMDSKLEDEQEYLVRTEKRMADIQSELIKPFEKADRLAWLQQRQREIDASFGLNVGELAATEDSEVSVAA